MFAYCGNNPVSRVDSEGTCWNILGGALVGALVGAVSQMICNVIDSEPLLNDVADSMITGAIGGALTAAFPSASTVINVGMSVVESIKSDVEEGKNLPTIAVNAVLSAGFAAISSGDTVFSDKNIVGKTVNALMDILPGNHPKVKATAGKFLTETFEAVGEEISSGITEGVVINRIGTWSKNVCGLYTGDNESYEKFQQLLG